MKKCLVEKVYILAKDVNTGRKFEIKAQRMPILGCILIQAVEVKLIAWILFSQNAHLITKY